MYLNELFYNTKINKINSFPIKALMTQQNQPVAFVTAWKPVSIRVHRVNMCTKRKPSTEQAFSSSADRTAEAGKLVQSSKAHFIWVECSLVLLRLATSGIKIKETVLKLLPLEVFLSWNFYKLSWGLKASLQNLQPFYNAFAPSAKNHISDPCSIWRWP